PGVITYKDGAQPQRTYAFVRGANGKLYVNFWKGSQWEWADQGMPPGTSVVGDPGVITYKDGAQPQRIYAFVRGANSKLYVNFWKGSQWEWADQGMSLRDALLIYPGVITYKDGAQPQRIYAFVGGAGGKLYVNFWKGSQW